MSSTPLVQGVEGAAGGSASTPGPDLNVVNYTHGRPENPGFEDWSGASDARDWGETTSTSQYTWVAQAPWSVNNGTYSAGMQAYDPSNTYFSSVFINQYNIYADMRKTNLTFHWNLNQNEYPNTDYLFASVVLVNQTTSTYYYMYYALNGTPSWYTNSTRNVYYLGESGPTGQWNRFSRNISADVVSVGGYSFPTTIGPDLKCYQVLFQLYTASATSGPLQGFLDDVYLKNDTTTWIGGATQNGNFESGNLSPWAVGQNQDPSYISQSATAHTGTWSANSTSLSLGNTSQTMISGDIDIRATNLNQANLSFWWHLTLQNPDSSTRSLVYISIYDGISYRNVRYWLGYGGSSSPYGNNSGSVYFHAPSFNTTGSWVYFSRNFWADAMSHFTTATEIYIRDIQFETMAVGSGERVVALIDDVRFVGHSVNGAGFEDQPDAGQRVRGFTLNTDSRLLVTSTAYSGSKAANFTIGNSGFSDTMTQYLRGRPFNGTRETYLDVMWNIQDTSPDNYFYIEVELQNTTDNIWLRYYLCGLPGLTNNSNYVYINAIDADTTGSWIQLHRDLWHDWEAAGVGSLSSNLYVHEVRIFGSTVGASGGRMEVLLDDLYLYDDPAPNISYVGHIPGAPDHGETVDVSTDVEDQDVDTVLLHYRADGSGWSTVTMATGGGSYHGDIPGHDYDTLIEYYVTANDTWGMTTTDDNGGSYYSYTVADTTAPSIMGIVHIIANPTYDYDPVLVNATITDAQSGVSAATVVYRLDGEAWQPAVTMTHAGSLYWGQIPKQPWNTLVEYYVNATNGASLDNNSDIYSYVVGDTTDPAVSVLTPVNGATVSGAVNVNVTATDGDGSGIAYIEIYIGTTLYHNTTSASFVYSLDTTALPDSEYTIQAIAYDAAGNSYSNTISITTINQLLVAQQGQMTLLLVASIAIIIVIVVLVLYFLLIRKRK